MMNPITIETPITVEPLDQTPTLLDLANWLSTHFPDVIAATTWPTETSRLPVIEW